MIRTVFLALAMLGATACAQDPRTTAADAGAGADASTDGEHLSHTDNGDGTTTTMVDATSESVWIYLDLGNKREVSPESPETSGDWDLGFQRATIKTNGGISGNGGVKVALVPGADFDAMTRAPTSGWITDAADSPEDDDTDPDLALMTGDGRWYDYDPATHVLSPKDIVYVLQSTGRDYMKLRILDYYDGAGTSGYLSFKWGPVLPPESQTARDDNAEPEGF